MRRLMLALLAIGLAIGAGFSGEGKKWRIALSNDYAGNSWRQIMISDWNRAAAAAIKEGLVSEAPVFTTNESSASEQAAQLQSLILEGYDAIVLDAASPTALNSVVQEALEAGVVVVSFDNAITLPAAWRLITQFEYMGYLQVEYLARHYPRGGNLLEVRGIPGTYVDSAVHRGIVEPLAKYPQFKIVAEVYGHWTNTIAQKEVAGILPSLPELAGIVNQGGDGYGIVKAYEAAGRQVPPLFMGNRYDELLLWKEMYERTGFDTISIAIAPGSATLAFWVAVEILAGTEVPKEIQLLPYVIDTHAKLEKALETTPRGGVASIVYPHDWVKKLIANIKAGLPPPPDPE
ncbi:MAG: ABC transporter substrate-binding protein [Planctomycetota bacterium]|jgi:ribose transport system substrate-binding protein|nr:ABC transporter substrate-binding protein [Planctomycetota bacterium]